MLKRRIGAAVVAVAMATAGGLALADQGDEAVTGAGVGLANPASVFCEEQGGTVEIVAEAEGSHGLCHLPDGSVVDEWEHWHRHH